MKAVTAALAVVALVAWRPDAHACSHPSQPGSPYLVFPAPGSIDVPTNVELSVYQSTFQQGTLTTNFRLRDPAGTLSDATAELIGHWGSGDLGTESVRITPVAPL